MRRDVKSAEGDRMRTRDLLEMILELHEDVQNLNDRIVKLFNKVYYEELKRQREEKEQRNERRKNIR